MRSYTGIDLPEFERFKVEFRTTAYACHMLSCPRATLGFDTEEELREHEASHLRILCDAVGCQYPAFSSLRALKEHRSKCHPNGNDTVGRRGIRRSQPRFAAAMSLKESYQSQQPTVEGALGKNPSLNVPFQTDKRSLGAATSNIQVSRKQKISHLKNHLTSSPGPRTGSHRSGPRLRPKASDAKLSPYNHVGIFRPPV